MKNKVQHMHFVGIGGSGMSGIAKVLIRMGHIISGSDLVASASTRYLTEIGACITIGHKRSNVGSADIVVVSSAIPNDNEEVVEAHTRNIAVIPRAAMLAELMRRKHGIAVAGTHGKTTTAGLVTSILMLAGLDPTFIIGGQVGSLGTNSKLGQGKYIVVEADESDSSLLSLLPMTSVITNIDADHMDTYNQDIECLKRAFVKFTQLLPACGKIILCLDDKHASDIIPLLSRPVVTYGLSSAAQIMASNIRSVGTRMHFCVQRQCYQKHLSTLQIDLALPGLHNVHNALAAIAVASELVVPDEAILQALADFSGIDRRFTQIGSLPVPLSSGGGLFTLVDDYSHHPTEIIATLSAARNSWPERRVVVAFQAHRYTRTRDSFLRIIGALKGADIVLLTEIYPAGERPLVGVDGHALAYALHTVFKTEVYFNEDVLELPNLILDCVRHDDIVIVMGAGSISRVVPQIIKLL